MDEQPQLNLEDTSGIITKSEVLRILSKRIRNQARQPRGSGMLLQLIDRWLELTAIKTTYREPGQKPLGRPKGKTKNTLIKEATAIELVKKLEADRDAQGEI